MSDMLPRFIEVLQQANFDMTAEEVAETLWLALQMSPTSEETPAPGTQDGLHGEVLSPAAAKQAAQMQELSAKAGATSSIYLPPSKPIDKNVLYQGGMPVRVPAARALTEPLALGRALRPLRRRRPSRKRFVLNERATVQRIAETEKRVWAPVVEPAPMRWFELALVIDEGASMIFWQQTIAELQKLFERLGAFRDIRVWRLTTDDRENVQLYAGKGLTTQKQPAHNPKELLDPTGRRLILVVTDCVSPAWYSGEVQKVLEQWGQKNLVTLLQMLPRRLWPRTTMCAAETMRISASAPGMANVRLKTPGSRLLSSLELSIPLPVVTLEPKSLASWARLVMGIENTRISGIMFGKDLSSVFPEPSLLQEEALTVHERVRTFRAAASPTARKLAGLLSAIPISLPIVRIVQQTMLRESTQVHVAEVFLGGLLKETYRDHTTPDPEYIEYEFLPGIRDELCSTLPMPDEHQVLRAVSTFIENHFDRSRDFLARVATPTLLEEFAITEESRPFAKITTTILRKRGGEYAALADQLEEQIDEYDVQPPELPTTPEGLEDVSGSTRVKEVEVPPNRPVLNHTFICPSCFEQIRIEDCRIVSGITLGKVLKEAPQGWLERQLARFNPERLNNRQYALELAHRECPKCGYLLPYNIERVKNLMLAVVGDVFAGKSHYIAALIHQIKADWISNATGYVRLTCLTPEVEKRYVKYYLEPLFKDKLALALTQPAEKTTAEPLIYELLMSSSSDHSPTPINLIIYDASGEDYERMERLVNFARFVFNTSAFIFVADPVMMPSIFTQLPPQLQAELQTALTVFHITEERRAADRLNAVISLYERYHGFPTGATLSDIPVAVMASKADLFNLLNLPYGYQFMENPPYGSSIDLQDIDKVDQEVRELLETYRQADLLATTRRFKRVKFFATSATGEPPDATGHFAKVEPRRCLDPLLWILYQFGIIRASK